MSLKQWADNGWLKPHRTSRKEISSLLNIVERDLNDARGDISSDWRFGIVYNAALKLCRILLSAEGYRPSHELQHYRTLAALPEILGEAHRLEERVWSPMGKGRVIQRLGGGDIPAPSEWFYLPGQAVAGGADTRAIER